MKAMVMREYGPPEVLKLEEVEKPTPKDDEVLIKIRATSINFGDTLARNFKEITPAKFHMPFLFWLMGKLYFGFEKPKVSILGSEFAGDIDAVGKDVRRFKVGDQVFGYRGPQMGCYAEYLRMGEKGVAALKPKNMSYEEAAAIPYGAIMALNLLRRIEIQPGQKLLINGASGGIGPLIAQIAKHNFGAAVTGVCGTARSEYVKSLGVDAVIDYTKEDFTAGDETYDFIIDILGKLSFERCKRVLASKGRLIFVSFKMKQVLQSIWTSMRGGKKVICAVLGEKAEDLVVIKELVEAGKIRAIIDRSYPLEQAAEAHRYVDEGRRTGNVVITVGYN
jgi:NADPH:quinone reductase-like Zn-dependent oxidoreductase